MIAATVEHCTENHGQARLAAAIWSRPGECPLPGLEDMLRHGLQHLGRRARADKSFKCCRIAKIGIDPDSALKPSRHVDMIGKRHQAATLRVWR